ncbi:MAG TPA: hypothetical protein VJV79_09350 [Polyangiaceae bacterium]|nr:hypothetical protein [Polyangiaceae bacterium]
MALNTRIGPTAVAAALGLAALAGAGSVKAITCAEVAQSAPGTLKDHVIYGAGGSAITATLARVALTLSKADPPILVFFADPGAQQGYNYFRDGNGAGKTGSEFKYWLKDADLTAAPKCTAVDTLAGQATDFGTIGSSLALFGETLPADTLQFFGPAQGINIIVPKASPETSISAEALYFVYGFGDASQYSGATAPVPWTNKAFIIQRKSSSFVQQFIRGAIQKLGGEAANFPASFPGSTLTETCSPTTGDTNGGTVNCVEAAATAGQTAAGIGFTSGPTADAARARVHTLAYQHAGQTAGYWPDSTPDSFDKRNIRSGQYYLWDVNQFFVKTTGSNANPTLDKITNPDLRRFIGYFSGQLTPPADADVNRAISETGSIPLCAMHAQRASDFEGLSCYAPPEPCDCYFESIATGATSCTACKTDDQCGGDTPKCHFGFCEAY